MTFERRENIEVLCDRQRLNSTNTNLSPVRFEKKIEKKFHFIEITVAIPSLKSTAYCVVQ